MSTAKKLSAILFFIIIAVVPVLIFCLPIKTFSENENRVLANFPPVSVNSILSGEFMRGFEDYVADHFFLRDDWIAAQTRMELASGKREVNGVYILKDRLIGKFEDFDRTFVTKNTNALKAFASNVGIPCTLMLVPTASEIERDMIDGNAPSVNQKILIDSVYSRVGDSLQTVDVYSALETVKNEYIYYKTDHHWTSMGAYYGYSSASKILGFQAIPLNDFDIQHVSHNFLGTLYSKVIYDDMGPDTIDYYIAPQGDDVTSVVVNPGDKQQVYNGMYFKDYLTQKDQYASFLGPNQPVVTVNTDNTSGKKILVIKDSYANTMMPFLSHHYTKLTMIDLRYLNQPLDKVVDLSEYDQILFLYNVESFAADKDIAKLNTVK